MKLTLFVLLVQLIGPWLTFQWAVGQLGTEEAGHPVFIWDRCNMAGELHARPTGRHSTNSSSNCAGTTDTRGTPLIQEKILGTLFMVLIFLNADQLLDQMDRQSFRLMSLFPYSRREWVLGIPQIRNPGRYSNDFQPCLSF